MTPRTLSIYDSDRRWLGSWTIPSKVRAVVALRDALAAAPECQRPVFYRVGSSGPLREVRL